MAKLELQFKEHTIDLTNETIIMGILNLSQDSPIKRSIVSPDQALERASALQADGASIIDVGAHSTSSKANGLSTDEEVRTIIPIISQLIDNGILVSLDSWNPTVVQKAAEIGLEFVNDITGLTNKKMVDVVKKFDVMTCIMHMRGKPKKHYTVDQHYDNISIDIKQWFANRIVKLEKEGIKQNKLILDPGFEFGKSMSDNLALLNNLNIYLDFNLPLLVSASNKAFIAEVIGLGRMQHGEGLLEATLAVQTVSSYLGAHILRVHDVKRVSYAVKVVNSLKKEKLNFSNI